MKKLLKPALWIRDKARSLTQDQRATLYRWGTAASGAAVTAGYITDDKAQVVLLALGLALGLSVGVVAKSNTPHTESGSVVRTFKPGD